METLTLFGIVFSIYIPALILPGPDFIITTSNCLNYSKKNGFYTILGLSIGYLTHIFYSLIGITIILSQSEVILTILKSIGAFYLIYLGYKLFFLKNYNIEFSKKKIKKEKSNFNSFIIGFFTSALNPKSMLFFLSIFTIIIKPETSNQIILLLVFCIWLVYVFWYFIVVILFTQKRIQIIYNKFQKKLNKIFGLMIYTFGILILFDN